MTITLKDGKHGPLNPQALRLADMARILSASGPEPVTVEMLQADIDDGRTDQRRRNDEPRALRGVAGEGDGRCRLTRDNCDRPNWSAC